MFCQLPLELLPHILVFLPKPHNLTRTALVNYAFYQSSIPKLYARASIYAWHKDAKTRIILLFRTLATCPQLARYIRRLDIRDFPKYELTNEIEGNIIQGLRNCINLRSCTWTRDGSLTSDILLALVSPVTTSDMDSLPPGVPSLREFEFNGHHSRMMYDKALLLRFKWLEKITIIMPTTEIVQVLKEWVKVLNGRLTKLNLVCKNSPLITDDILIQMAPYLKNLDFLHLTGCPKVTQKGLRAVLLENKKGIMDLGLESISPRIDLSYLLPTSTTPKMLRNLRGITLSIPPPPPIPPQVSINSLDLNDSYELLNPAPSYLINYTQTLLSILFSSPLLDRFHIYSPHTFFEPNLATTNLFHGLIRDHGETLKRISVHRMLVGSDVIREICIGCPNLEEFFIVVEPEDLDTLADYIHLARNLRTVHVNYPLEAHSENGVLGFAEATHFVRRCKSSTLAQFGCNARVWHVKRNITIKEDGDMDCEVYLGPYESPDIPEQFLVVRT